MKTFNTHSKRLLIGLMLALVMLGGCENFMTNDKDFKSALKQEVAVANAEKVDLTIMANAGSTTTSPTGVQTEKVGVSFNIYVTVDSDYGFTHWAAFASATSTEELTDVVSFSDPKAQNTQATLNKSVAGIVIKAVCEKRPVVSSKLPEGGFTVVRNFPIKIYFSKPIDPSSFIYGKDSAGANIYRQGDLFKNLIIQGNSSALEATDAPISYTQYFEDPVLSAAGNVLTIKVKPGNVLPSKKKISVTVSKTILDTSNISMSKDYDWTYYTNTETDTTPPTIDYTDNTNTQKALLGGSTSAVSFAVDSATHRLKTGSVWLSVKASDDIASVDRIYVTETHPFNAAGTASGDPLSHETYYDYGNDPTVFEVPLTTTSDGIIQLSVQLTDTNGNRTAIENADKYFIIRDTVAPSADNGAYVKYSGATSAGYFNASTYTTINFKDTTNSIHDAGYAGDANILAHAIQFSVLAVLVQ